MSDPGWFISVALLRGWAPRQASGLGCCLDPTQDCVPGHFSPGSSPFAFNAYSSSFSIFVVQYCRIVLPKVPALSLDPAP
jgi:hypothetical protein